MFLSIVNFVFFFDAVSNSDYVASNNEYWITNWKGFGRTKQRCYLDICLEELKETTKNLSQHS